MAGLVLCVLSVLSVFAFATTAVAVVQTTPSSQNESATSSQDQEAVAAAKSFVTRWETGDLGDVYDRDTADMFKTLMSRDLFIQQGGLLRVQAGGAALARELVGQQAFSQIPSGARGEFYYVRFRSRFPNGLAYEDVYLQKSAGNWKVAGFYLLPAAQQP